MLKQKRRRLEPLRKIGARMKKAKSENDAVKIGEPVNILKVNVAGGMYSGVLMVVLIDIGSGFLDSVV